MAPNEPDILDVDGNVHTDFEKAFRDGYQFQYSMGHWGPAYRLVTYDVEFVTHYIGDLLLPSGHLVACDPGIRADFEDAFTQTIQPGRYPIILSLAGFKPEIPSLPSSKNSIFNVVNTAFRKDQNVPRPFRRIACTMLKVTQQKPVRWEVAFLNPDWSAEYQNYGVDSGTGCFMDVEIGRILKQLGETKPDEEWDEALNRFCAQFYEPLMDERRKNETADVNDEYPYDTKGDWANLCIDEETGANVIVFGSGWGDGGYASYWGYDADDNIACLVTDFALFGSDGDDDEG